MTNDQSKLLQPSRQAAPLGCQLIVDPPGEGAWNMAVDEALLDLAADDGVASLRFYQWTPATLSLGYFQAHADRAEHAGSAECPLVRRHSGGGAIVHHHELTYSLALPPNAYPTNDPFALYETVHRSLRDCLIEMSAGELAGRIDLCSASIEPAAGREPFLCFLRRARGDLLVKPANGPSPDTIDGNHKVTGSSQRKRRGAVLQHGSVLTKVSPCAHELPGLADLVPGPLTAARIAENWAPRLASDLQLAITKAGFDEPFLAKAREICAQRFAEPSWIKRR